MRIYKLLATGLLISVFASSKALFAQLKMGNPVTEGFSVNRLDRIDSLLLQFTEKDKMLPGVVALVSRDGKIIYYYAAGYRNIETGKKLEKTDLYRIASQTKIITAVAVMILYEEGKILLDDPISKYISEFKQPKVLDRFNQEDTSYTTKSASREIRIRDLLTHTSGISYPVIGAESARAIYAKAGISVGLEPRKLTLEKEMKKLARLPILHQPGEQFTYGLNMDVLGYLVEVVSGQSFNRFLQQKLFNPLGMKDTYFYVPEEKQDRLAKVYEWTKNGLQPLKNIDSSGLNDFYPLTKNGTYYSGGGGLVSTAYDYASFLQMLANHGQYDGHQILSPATVQLMTKNQLHEKAKRNLSFWKSNPGFGLGGEVIEEGIPQSYPWNPGTFSWGGYWGSLGWVDPQAGIVAEIWTQSTEEAKDDLLNKFKVLVYSALVNP